MRRGFTLLELSIVLVIISLVTAMAVTSGISVISTARQAATLAKMTLLDSSAAAVPHCQ
jgi:prepilin-type N-terminal cleavage/methylation domain-containing protein